MRARARALRRHFAHPVVRRIGDPDAVFAQAAVSTVSKPAPMRLTMPSLGSADDALGDRRYCSRIAVDRGRREHVVLGAALGGGELDTPRPRTSRARYAIGKIVVGEEDPDMASDGAGDGRAPEAQ